MSSKIRYRTLAWSITVPLSLAFFLFTSSAWGELGGNIASIKVDQQSMQGSLQVTSAGNYQVHQIQTAQGATVREFVSPSGTVFGVAWHGQFTPDLRQLLGPYFDQYVGATQGKKTVRGPVAVQLPGFVIQRGGHQGSFSGRAYLSQMVPQGVSVDAIK